MTIDSRIFRNALGCFPTGITVITTCDAKGAPVGVTVSSFTSVSLDPPLILFCLDNKTQRLEAFRSNQHFAVNVLRHSQIELSNRFSGRDEQLWREVEFRSGEQGVPLIEGCLACFECVREIIHEGGDHQIFIGRVERLRYSEKEMPLVYFRGTYAAVAP